MTDQYPPPPASVPPPDPTGNPPVYPPPADPYTPPADPQPAYPPSAYQPPAYPQQAYPQQAYPQQAYPPPGYPPPGYPPPGYPPPPGYQQPYGYPPADPGVNGFAIASLICGIIGTLLFSVIFGIVALNQIGKRGQRGRGIAIAGLTISGVWVLIFAGVIVFAIAQGPTTSATDTSSVTVVPTVADPTPTDTTSEDLVPGQCLNDLNGTRSHVTCSAPHDGEVYAVFNLKNGEWPGDTAVKKQAEAGCDTRLDSYAKNPGKLDFYYLYPDESYWPDDRSVICIAADPNDKQITGSVRR